MYRCICHTCDEEELRSELESAQAYFNDHAERSHEVEIRKLNRNGPDDEPLPGPDEE